eukprot:415770-Karenia_brevis.AAC.1
MDDPRHTPLRPNSADVDALRNQLQEEQARAQELIVQTQVQARAIDRLETDCTYTRLNDEQKEAQSA